MTALFTIFAISACAGNGEGVDILETETAQPEYLSFFSAKGLIDSDVAKYWKECFTEKYNKQVYINYDDASYYDAEGLSYRELLVKRLGSSAPDDLYIIKAEDVLEFEKKGYWMDLSDFDFVSGLSKAALYQSTYKGKVFSVPLSFTGFGFVWNVDMLAQYNLGVPRDQAEFIEVCQTLKEAGILPYGANRGYALTVPAMCAGLSQLYESPDLSLCIEKLNSGETNISLYMEAGFEFLAGMIENGFIDTQQALASTPGIEDKELFLSGGCAFMCAALGNASSWSDVPFEFMVTGVPVLEDGSKAVFGADWRLCINPNSKRLEAAIEFVEMVGTPEALAQSAIVDNTMSTAKDGTHADLPMENRLIELLQKPGQIPNQDFSLYFNTWENIRDVGREICGGMTVEQACRMLDQMQAAEIAEYSGR